MSAQPSALAIHYICSICRQNVPLKDPILIGEKPAEKRARIGAMMIEHMVTNHQQEAAQAFAAGEAFKQLLIARTFNHNDAELSHVQEINRQKFRQFTALPGPVQITNEQIEATVENQLELRKHLTGVISPESIRDLRNAIVSLMQQMRDALVDSKG